MFAEFINTYGTQILYAILTGIASYIGLAIKSLYEKHINDKAKRDIVKTAVQFVEQVYKDLHGPEKLAKALDGAAEMLEEKGIVITEFELNMLIEAAVCEFNNAFNATTEEVA